MATRTSLTAPNDAELLGRLSHALLRVARTPPRTIVSPPTQPRRASVAILVRVRPTLEDEEWLAEQYDAEGQPIPGTEAAMMAEGLMTPTATPSGSEPMSRSQSQAQSVAPTYEGNVSSTNRGANLASSIPGLGGSHVSVGPVDQSIATLGASFTSSLLPREEGASSLATLDPQACSSLQSSPQTQQLADIPAQQRTVPVSTSSPMGGRSRAHSTTSAGSIGFQPALQIPSMLPIERFFQLPWVQRGTPEILYIKRASRVGDNWSAHVAFPGGRQEEEDENGLYTAMRETWEEVGIDLAEKEFACVGQLDDREITTSLGKRLLMVLSPFLFIQVSPFSPHPDLQPTEVASAHWIPLSLLYTPTPNWGITSVDIANRLAPKSPAVRWVLRTLVGKMDFRCILLPNDPVAEALDSTEGSPIEIEPLSSRHPALIDGEKPQLRLWGLTLGMTLDVLAHMSTRDSEPPVQSGRHSRKLPYERGEDGLPTLSALIKRPVPTSRLLLQHLRDELHLSPPPHANLLAPSMTSVFPKFSYPDVNFWIWVFGWRYRAIVRGWERGLGTGMERGVNWSGMALGAFYSAVRRALIVAILLRALGMLSSVSVVSWLIGRRIRRRRKGLPGFGLEELFPSLRD
ncbi:hypothetical protein K437DRAFT_263741 [Tilletiaria anomala UBC 951]|uniref:Nudix hydrolase domain-containing protein n=1 Tax=Tilletiaria anomala (strain ATCC 24038 / CBS 436.72 / UBC 951) TaxID=1037660 RepID=A0A066VQS5_TILAU|nr:uncharacterized protein K437DRAFT_263741 [Tilletiaria anomala UBC 951]KDN42628.1 hypothetical protein K437DRAFT_263741 [Tilletiaria anomala UBC 951]